MYHTCDGCGNKVKIVAPVQLCFACGVIFKPKQRKYIIDFTVAKHGHYEIRAKTEEEARKLFNGWIAENKKEAAVFMDHFTINCDIKINYAYIDGS